MLKLFSNLMLTIPEEDAMYGYNNSMSADDDMIIGIVVLVWLGLMLFSLANYILFSLGLYNVAKNNNVSAPGLAWVPIAREWVKGSIVDFHAKKKGYDSKWRVILPIFACLPIVVVFVLYIVVFATALSAGMSDMMAEDLPEEVFTMILSIFIAYALLIVSALLNTISSIIVDYKIYEEVVPKRAVLYIFLSYLIPLAHGICLLSCQKYGNGTKQEPIYAAPHTQNNFGFGYQPQPQQQQSYQPQPQQPQFYQPQPQQQQSYQPQPQQPQSYQPQPESVEPLQTLEYIVEDEPEPTVEEIIKSAPIEENAPTEDVDDSDIFTE